jgi:hypothetical protein
MNARGVDSFDGVFSQVRCRSARDDRIDSKWMAYTTHEAGTEIELKFTPHR